MPYYLHALILAAIFLALPLPAQRVAEWAYHECREGDKDYAPGHSLDQRSATAGFEVAIVLDPADWYDPALLGREASDWLKAAGVSYFSFWRPATWPKNRLSALVGFRLLPDRRYEVCAYVNDAAGGFRYDGALALAAGDTAWVSYRLDGETARYEVRTATETRAVAFTDFASTGRQVAVGPWHGGSLPAPRRTGLHTRLRWIE